MEKVIKTSEQFCELLLNKPVIIEFMNNTDFKRIGGIVHNIYRTEVGIFLELIDVEKMKLFLVPVNSESLITMKGKVDNKDVKSES